ncbi:MAG: EpsG family protein [Alistipes sp.]|nr:EpsG family protein [Alistipes sp.]
MLTPAWFDGVMLFILLFTLFIATTQEKIPNTHWIFTALVAVIAIVQLGFAPITEEVGTDRLNYSYMFSHADELTNYGFRDIGFAYYTQLCHFLTGTDVGGFVITAIIYVGAYIYFCRKANPDRHLYFILLCFLSLGFTNHSYNVLRAGLCIAILLIAISKEQNKYVTLLLFITAVSCHIVALLLILGYVATKYITDTRIWLCLWVVMALALFMGFFDSFEQWGNAMMSLEDDRFEHYLLGNDLDYETGLRIDFIAYSLFPIIVGGYYIYAKKYQDLYYKHLYNTYILCNTCWLVISKMPYNDRFAYLSWFIMPFILLYPILDKSENNIKSKKLIFVLCISIVVGLNIYLKYLR